MAIIEKIVLVLVLLTVSGEALAADAIAPADIKATFGNGVPFTAVSDSDKTYTLILRADGTAMRAAKKSSIPAMTGTWRVSETGYFSKWGKGAESCYAIQKATASSYSVLNSSGAVVATWKK